MLPLIKSSEQNDEEKDATTETKPGEAESSTTISKNPASYFIAEDVTDAEILWALDVIVSNNSLNSCLNKKRLFSRMFKGSKIAELFSCGSTKCSYVINFGIAPYFRLLLEENIREAPYHVRCFDESHNKSVHKGQMDMHIRFWDQTSNTVKTRYYNSEFLTKATAVDIHLTSNHLSSEDYEICGKLRKSVRAARSKYDQYLIEQRKEKVDSAKRLKRKSIQEEIDSVRSKKALIEKSVASLIDDADKFAKDAEQQTSVEAMKTLIMKSNSYRKTISEKENEIKECSTLLSKLVKDKDRVV